MKIDDVPFEDITKYLLTLNTDVDPPRDFKIGYSEMPDKTQLRYFTYTPDSPKNHIVIVPGFMTVLMSWYRFILLLKKENYRITYIETREKYSSKMENKSLFTEQIFVDDIYHVITELTDKNGYIAIGSSNGSNILIKAIAQKKIHPKYCYLIGPYANFHVSLFIRIALPFFTNKTYKWIFLPLIRLIILPKLANKEADKFQAKKYEIGMTLSDAYKLKHAFRALQGKELWSDLPDVKTKKNTVILVGAGTDPLHGVEVTKKVSEQIEGSLFFEVNSNFDAHDIPMIEILQKTSKNS